MPLLFDTPPGFPFLLSPWERLTLDVVMEEVDSAPMEDGALLLPRLHVDPMFERPAPRLDLRRDGVPLSLRRFPGYKAHGFCWVPYGLYDVAATLAGDK